MIGSSGQNPNPNPYPASAVPSSSSSSSVPSGGCGGGGGGGGGGGDASLPPMASSDPRLPLLNLAALGQRMESLRRFLADPGDHRSPIAAAELSRVSSEIASAVHQIILNGAALLASSHPLDLVPLPPPDPCTNAAPIASDGPDPRPPPPPPPPPSVPTAEPRPDGGGGGDDGDSEESEIVEIDAAELLAEHIHFCEICGKGFKRDANLRMHMRAHGDRFKTLEALSGSGRTAAAAAGPSGRKPLRFSCPFPGCNRNRAHRRFRPLKSAVCVKNHFKRSHCPKMYACHRCNKKSFSVLADLKSHLKHCGETPWRCSCGTSFSRKDKLFGHLALFEGHFPAVPCEEAATGKRKEKPEINRKTEGPSGGEGFDPDFFEGLMDEFEGISEEPMNWLAR